MRHSEIDVEVAISRGTSLDGRPPGGNLLREYVFITRSGGQLLEPPLPVLLDHDEAALSYACEMANQLRKSGRYNDPGLVVSVMDQCRRMIFSVPLLAACA